MQAFVRTGALIGWPELIRGYGQNPSALLRELGLGTGVLHDPDLYLPYPTIAELFSLSAQRCVAPDFGVQLGRRQGLDVVGALGSAMCLQSTLGDALRLMQMNLGFHARGVWVDVEVVGDFLDMRMHFDFVDQTNCDQLIALSLALMAHGVGQLHVPEQRPTEVQLSIAALDITGSYARAFGCAVAFGGTDNRLRYPASLLSLPVHVDESLRLRLSQQWRGDWQQAKPVSLGQQVERAITALLPTGECSLNMVAKLVDIHPRSLQTRLKQCGDSFASLLQQVRLRLACQYLQNSNIDLTTLAMNLGFTELAVFSRAFKKWTGQSPRQWRNTANLT